MTTSPLQIGESPENWPLTWRAKKHASINCEASLKKAGNQNCSCIACQIFVLQTVIDWVRQADEYDQADRRACSLITAVATASYNAKLPFATPARHRKHYLGVAERLEKKRLGGKRLAKLKQDLRNDKLPAFQRYEEGQDVEHLAQAARVFAGACESPNWTNPRPKHRHAPRDDLIRSLTNFQRKFAGQVSHVLTAEIANALFTEAEDQIDRRAVERLVRLEKTVEQEKESPRDDAVFGFLTKLP